MVYFLPNEFMAPANLVVQEETSLDDEQLGGLMAQLVLAKQAIFDKPAKNRHMRPLYLKGYVNGKPLTKMFVDGGAAVNVMPYTTFRKLCMGPGDLTPTSIILNDFAGNPSDTKGCVHVDLMIGSKTFTPIAKEPTAYCLGGTGFTPIVVSHPPCISSSFNGWITILRWSKQMTQ
jgi:hypothetical protein